MNHKSCPFCGNKKLSVEYLHPAWGWADDEKEAHVVCDECASSSPVFIWNMRKKENQQQTESLS